MKKILGIFIFILFSMILIGCEQINTEKSELLKAYADSYTFNTSIEGDIFTLDSSVEVSELGTVNISFRSSNLEVLSLDGVINRSSTDIDITITIIFEFESLQEERSYLVTIKKAVVDSSYQVIFDPNNGSQTFTILVLEGNQVLEPSEPTKSGFRFIGWYLGDTLFDFDQTIEGNITLIARYDEIIAEDFITISFDSDGGSEIDDVIIEKNTTLENILVPTKEGYMFKGWYKDDVLVDLSYVFQTNTTLLAHWELIIQTYRITLETNGGNHLDDIILESGQKLEISVPVKEGHIFIGWFLNDVKFDMNQVITSDITLHAKWIISDGEVDSFESGAYLEAIYAIFEDTSSQNATVRYKKSSMVDWIYVDQELIRQQSLTHARVDIVGLESDYYDIEIVTSNLEVLRKQSIFTESHDRSGYAHFNYTEGIGAYLDNGTLKPDAKVVYVTEENKNDVEIEGIMQKGLGWILNNNQYQSSSSNTYSTEQSLNSLSTYNTPIVFRIIGKVTAPEGLTVYNSTQQGGSVGDNGNMARIRNGKNITIEGIGEDAEIYGWGIHLIASTAGRGTSFEVRNLTFRHYPEDAIGLEGIQTGSQLTAPVSRGWMHHLTFFEGYHPNPAESDKSHGDGSLDIKRGEYFTISYNQFLGAHKTNLVGSSDTSLQYHITYHHNHWKNNASRIPLARNSNIHMYNNVFETTDDNQNESSYAQNTRVNAYILSEANYFYATKNPSRVDSGAIKSYKDVKYSTYDTDQATVVENREDLVNSGNKFEHFDTNKDVFYYDPILKRSDVKHLTDAVTARAEVEAYAGVFKPYQEATLIPITNVSPTVIHENVTQAPVKINKGVPLLVFEIYVRAEITLTQGSTSVPPVLVTIYGEKILVGSGTAQLEPGQYVIESNQAHGASKGTSQAKESNAGYQITLDTEAASQARIDAYNLAIDNLSGNTVYTADYLEKITYARTLFDSLLPNEKESVSDALLLTKETEYMSLGKAFVESKIMDIGEVTKDSLIKIKDARNAYQEATLEIKQSITNYQTLINAEILFESFKISALNDAILDLLDVSEINITSESEVNDLYTMYQAIYEEYILLDEAEKSNIIDATKLTEGVKYLEDILAVYELIEYIDSLVIEEINRYNSTELLNYYELFGTLDISLIDLIPSEIQDKLEAAYEKYLSIEGIRYQYIPEFSTNTSNYFTYQGDNPVTDAGTFNILGNDLNKALKLNSSATLTFTTQSSGATLYLAVKTRSIQTGGRLDINGQIFDLDTLYNALGIAIIEITLDESGTYIIKRDNRELALFYVEVIE
ncbi:Pectate trisaccharide-lyase precursor [Acholeplasma oculi]|uniref:Pectin lyase n=1 Tax=Acholeplasma oculi TaxID=35623 RepID=A0A061AI39_9MOLU|nr:InlB B-repeat-containing protein [Acholeplasma oculi]CDR31241.1 Pectin lyase [Acholeplasma oculi]SKC38335.1 Listeria/Bacterioides repeat-containing protein [Acholeplasma oculi]SUT91311.1 Pectate trisaccharide-lyase precursor [Acholeplasma oculi]